MNKGFNHRKTTQCLNFLAQQEGGKINKMKALKLIWLADRYHLRKYGKLISNDTYFALKNGPVASGTRDLLESSSFLEDGHSEYSGRYISADDKYTYSSIAELDKKVFSKADLETLSLIYQKFGGLGKYDLSELSHEFPEWKKYEISLQNDPSARFPISYLDFFKNPEKESYGVFNEDDEYLEESKEIFTELVAL